MHFDPILPLWYSELGTLLEEGPRLLQILRAAGCPLCRGLLSLGLPLSALMGSKRNTVHPENLLDCSWWDKPAGVMPKKRPSLLGPRAPHASSTETFPRVTCVVSTERMAPHPAQFPPSCAAVKHPHRGPPLCLVGTAKLGRDPVNHDPSASQHLVSSRNSVNKNG